MERWGFVFGGQGTSNMNAKTETVLLPALLLVFTLFACGPLKKTASRITEHAISETNVTLAWDYKSSNEVGFKIEKRTEPDGSYSVIATVDRQTLRYTDTNLVKGKSYRYRVRAYNDFGKSFPSNEILVRVREE